MGNFTCQGCGDRHPGCHGQCEKYQKEKATYEEQRATLMKEHVVQGGLDAQRNNAIRKARKRRISKWGKDSQ